MHGNYVNINQTAEHTSFNELIQTLLAMIKIHSLIWYNYIYFAESDQQHIRKMFELH